MDAEALVKRLARDGLTLAVAESCTGGLLGARITDVPGASDVFVGGVIAYRDDVKQGFLDVPEKVLSRNGAVSAACVEAMAHGVRSRLGADMAIAVSGVAGPGGGSLRKPVGTVWVAILGPEHLLNAHKLRVKGDRGEVRQQAVAEALRLAMGNLQEAEVEGVA